MWIAQLAEIGAENMKLDQKINIDKHKIYSYNVIDYIYNQIIYMYNDIV